MKDQYPEKDYTMTNYTIEFSPPLDGEAPYIELRTITDQEDSGWKIDIIGSKQVIIPLYEHEAVESQNWESNFSGSPHLCTSL